MRQNGTGLIVVSLEERRWFHWHAVEDSPRLPVGAAHKTMNQLLTDNRPLDNRDLRVVFYGFGEQKITKRSFR